MNYRHFPEKQGLYDPGFEKDACGVGFVCNINGKKTHDIVEQGIEVLERLSHRGAVGADPDTGDGAGILIQIPHNFLLKVCKKAGISLPDPGYYGAGLVFLPQDHQPRESIKGLFENIVRSEGQYFLGWRDVPVESSAIGKGARQSMPFIAQIFIGMNENLKDQLDFERKLYVIRKQIENAVRELKAEQQSSIYITNFSSRTLSYKGLLIPSQLKNSFLI